MNKRRHDEDELELREEDLDVEGDQEFEKDDDVLVLRDEEGREASFRILFDALYVGDKQYVVLMPMEQSEELEPEIVILRVDQDEDGESILVSIDDDDEWERVIKAFSEIDIEENIGDYEIEVESDEDLPEDDLEDEDPRG